MIDLPATLARWKAIASDPSRRPWTMSEHLVGFFQRFRPDGDGLDRVFDGVVGADEIVPRLLEIYRATAKGWPEEDEEFDAYFDVESPPPLDARVAAALALRHLEKMCAMAEALGRDWLVAILSPGVHVEVVEGPIPLPQLPNDVETMIHEAIADFMRRLSPRESEALWMEKAFWAMACDDKIRHHVLWPLYRDSAGMEEPFRPYFELWKHGACCRFGDDGIVRVYVPRLVSPAGGWTSDRST